ncbi:hypothetical protein SAMN04488505_101493 [Chitinophaga rupis]|uniref:Fimbrillin-A associated anchor protein Mfa1 and Mfa2 n=1 Tax=Chitinophaga rupis TaxID=573321 RepID=A0A1H7I985_9BACT|nr:hypothetical protein [Chitinophaga rupis]SEK58988.1 hypothetical protein SAMN04488505_101493 [Chitinophaga rupis]
MKKSLFAALSLSVLLFACSKEKVTQDKPAPSGKKVPINVSITDFVKKVEQLPSPLGRKGNMSAKDSVLSTKISDIYFFSYDKDGKIINLIHQRSTDADFGYIADSLPTGENTIAMFASSDSLNTTSNGINLNMNPVTFEIISAFPDIFYKKIKINVSPDSTNNFDLSLERIMALLEVNITDAPANSNIKVSLNGEHTYFDPFSGTGYTGIPMPMNIPQRDQHVFNSLVINTSDPMSVVISYPDKTTNAILTKRINDIKLERNTKTILTGVLYPAIPPVNNVNGGFSVVSINDIWNPDQTIDF